MKTYFALVQSWNTTEHFGLDVWTSTAFVKGRSKEDARKRYAKWSDNYAGSEILRFIRISRPHKPKTLNFDLPF
jgi:hypothetical protein